MSLKALPVALLLLCVPLSGCITPDDVPDLTGDDGYIDDETELLDPEEDGYCGDLDGDGEPDCPLSGYTPGTNPWWCNSTGIGGHHVDPAYEGQSKGLLEPTACEELTYELKAAIEWTSQWPTLGDAEDDGYSMAVGYVEGMGTHHIMLNGFSMEDSGFDSQDPEFPGTRLDDVFEFDKPEFLMYSGEDSDSELVGFAWYVLAPTDAPPEGFTGDNDWWHRHDSLCFQTDKFLVVGENLDEQTCEDRVGTNVNLEQFWMVHAWIVRPWLTYDDVFTNHHPCLLDDGPEQDAGAECWAESTEHVGHDI